MFLIDPIKITNYNQSKSQLELSILFWCFAAGHNAISTAKGINKFLTSLYQETQNNSPFNSIRSIPYWSNVVEALGNSGLGCWRKKSRTIWELVYSELNLKTCSIEDLEEIYYIGPKTSRCFILHSREGVRVAGLDTHLLKYMKDMGFVVPKSTPQGKKYKVLEQEFLKLCDEVGKTPAEFDLELWLKYSNRN